MRTIVVENFSYKYVLMELADAKKEHVKYSITCSTKYTNTNTSATHYFYTCFMHPFVLLLISYDELKQESFILNA